MPGNELKDTGFELAAGDPVWVVTKGDGAVARDAAVFRSSGKDNVMSCKLTAGAGKDTSVTQEVAIGWPEHTYRLVLQSKGDGKAGGRVKVTSADGAKILTNEGEVYTLPAAAEWAETTLLFLPGADTHVHVTLLCPDQAGGVVYVDDPVLEQYCGWW